MDKWQPIETAPKGGGPEGVTSTEDPRWVKPPRILIKFADGDVSVGCWDWYYGDGGWGYIDGVAWVEPISGEQLNQNYGRPVEWMNIP